MNLYSTARRSTSIIIGTVRSINNNNTNTSSRTISPLQASIHHYSTVRKNNPAKPINSINTEDNSNNFSTNEKDKDEWRMIIQRMYDMISGKYKPPRRTRAQIFIDFISYSIASLIYFYWLTRINRYYIETEIERGVMEFNEKGKFVKTQDFEEALSVTSSVGYVKALKLERAMKELESDLKDVKRFNEILENIESRQIKIENEINSVYNIISKGM